MARTKTSVWGDAIRRHLRERGMTQTELARLAGIHRGTVMHVVQGGHCQTETLERLANALGVSLAELFQEPVDLGVRRDKLVAAVLRELSETISTAVDEHLARRRLDSRRRGKRGDTRLPFSE